MVLSPDSLTAYLFGGPGLGHPCPTGAAVEPHVHRVRALQDETSTGTSKIGTSKIGTRIGTSMRIGTRIGTRTKTRAETRARLRLVEKGRGKGE